jgi:hypothetical protein
MRPHCSNVASRLPALRHHAESADGGDTRQSRTRTLVSHCKDELCVLVGVLDEDEPLGPSAIGKVLAVHRGPAPGCPGQGDVTTATINTILERSGPRPTSLPPKPKKSIVKRPWLALDESLEVLDDLLIDPAGVGDAGVSRSAPSTLSPPAGRTPQSAPAVSIWLTVASRSHRVTGHIEQVDVSIEILRPGPRLLVSGALPFLCQRDYAKLLDEPIHLGRGVLHETCRFASSTLRSWRTLGVRRGAYR